MMTAETGAAERAQWIANPDEVAALEPTFVVAGHKKVENNDPKITGESQQYLRYFSLCVDQESTAAGIVAGCWRLTPIGAISAHFGIPPMLILRAFSTSVLTAVLLSWIDAPLPGN